MSLLHAAVLATLVFLSACGKDDPASPSPEPELPEGAVPAFTAEDVNPTSPRLGEDVSPRDYLGSVSAWYFGHAT